MQATHVIVDSLVVTQKSKSRQVKLILTTDLSQYTQNIMSTYNKKNKIFYIFFFDSKSSRSRVYLTLTAISQFQLATFQMLNSHMGLKAMLLVADSFQDYDHRKTSPLSKTSNCIY